MPIFTDSVDHMVAQVHDLTQVVHRTEHSSLICLRVEPERTVDIDPVAVDRFVFVSQGLAWAEIGEQEHRLAAGEVLVAPAGTALRVRAAGDVAVGLVVVVAGPTPDTSGSPVGLAAAVGDLLVVPAGGPGQPERDGEIVSVGADGAAPFTVRWAADGHLSVIAPGSGARITHPTEETR